MAAPGNDYINQAVTAVTNALKASPLFMASTAPDAPDDAAGVVAYVENDLPELGPGIPQQRIPHAGVVYLGHEPSGNGTTGANYYQIEIGIRLYNRGTDRAEVWRKLQQAAAAVTKLAESEFAGGRFGDFATLIWDKGGTAIDTVEQGGGFGAMLSTGIVMEIRRFY